MPTSSLQFRILNEIGIIAQLSQTVFERAMPSGMTLSQFTVLNHFARLGGMRSPAELASAFQVTRATMTSTLQRLEAKGFVAISPDPEDGRGKRVSLTDAGHGMRDQCIAALEPDLKRLAAMGFGERSEPLLDGLTNLRRELDASRPGRKER
ncbi:MAG: MarR family winged helix-turn-helix transcriptional regulator [Bosea sp. (in: a-proteobacteria)]